LAFLFSCSSKPTKSFGDALAEKSRFFDAIHKKDKRLVRDFIKNGIDANTADDALDTPLVLAAYYGDTEMARMLIDLGAAGKGERKGTSWCVPRLIAPC
jgi:hypothetical protein